MTGDLSLDGVLARVAELARTVAGPEHASVSVEDPPRVVSSGSKAGRGREVVDVMKIKGRKLGELRVSGRWGVARRLDEKALETFATQAGIAIENARLFEQVEELVATRERSRIGMELHDAVIQELYAPGLKVEVRGAATVPEATTGRAS